MEKLAHFSDMNRLLFKIEIGAAKMRGLICACLFLILSCTNSPSSEIVQSPPEAVDTNNGCKTLSCQTSKYSLFVADLDGSNVTVIKTSSFQEMTHPRVSADKQWVAYTFYNNRDSNQCASLTIGYENTEIRAIRLNGTSDKRIISPTPGQFNSNSYWLGNTNEFTFLNGPPSSLKFYRATVDSQMNLLGSPVQISVPSSIAVPMDPQANLSTGKIVFPGMYLNSGNYYKSIFIKNLSDSGGLVGLSLGRDRSGTAIVCNSTCSNINENDPKLSPDGTKVAFMRQAPDSGANGFGWRLFIVPVAAPLSEIDISFFHLGNDLYKNDVLPEWIDNSTLIFSTIEIKSAEDVVKNVYTMKSDGTLRTKINLPSGFKYADVFPFKDSNGVDKIVVAAEKIGATCSSP